MKNWQPVLPYCLQFRHFRLQNWKITQVFYLSHMKDERGCGYKVAKQANKIFGKLCEFSCKLCRNSCISNLYSLVYGFGTASLHFVDSYKGQLNSEWIYKDMDFPKWQQKYCKDFWCSFLGFPVILVSNIMNWIRKPTRITKKLLGSPKEDIKTFWAEILTIFSLPFWSKRKHQKDVSKLTDL